MNGARFTFQEQLKANISKEFKRCDSLKIERMNQAKVINCSKNFLGCH